MWSNFKTVSYCPQSALDHKSLPPEFESRRGNIWRVFHLWLRFITFGARSVYLACHMHKSGRKTLINHQSSIIDHHHHLNAHEYNLALNINTSLVIPWLSQSCGFDRIQPRDLPFLVERSTIQPSLYSTLSYDEAGV